MHVAILSSRPGWHVDELLRALAAAGHTGELLRYEDLVARIGARVTLASGATALDRCDVVLARIIPDGGLEQLIFRVDALHTLEEHGVRVVNPARVIERSVDKFWCSALLARAGLPTPETVVCETPAQALEACRAFGDAIIKPLFGSMGLGMVRVTDEEMAWRVMRTLEKLRAVCYVQRTVPHPGRDLRVFVVDGAVLGAIRRQAPGWKTNVSRGGTADAVELDAATAELAVRAAAAVGAGYAGVDLLPSDDGTTYVLEVNGIPGWEGLQAATGLDVAAAIVAHACRSAA